MIRKFNNEDKNFIKSFLQKISIFKPKEIEVATELIDDVSLNGEKSHYKIFVYEIDKNPVGFYCIGQRPLTDGVFDLYWIAVDPDYQSRGIGKKLIESAENFIKEQKGRWLLAETSSKKEYENARKFYMRNKFSIIASISDFYAIGDDLIIFGKYFKH